MGTRSPSRIEENPAQVLVGGFITLIGAGTLLLSLPVAAQAEHPGVLDALFLSTSAVTVTGLTSFDVSELSLFGEVVVLSLLQIGGFGVMTIGTVVGLLTARRLRLRQRMLARAEIGSVAIGEVRSLILAIVRITVAVEAIGALLLGLRFVVSYDLSLADGLYQGTYLSVSAFNNAGLLPTSTGLTPFVGDPVVIGVTSVAIILGGLGFPVLVELLRRVRPRRWTLHTKLVITATIALLVVGPAVVMLFEWTNPGTLGPLGVEAKVLAGWFQGVTPRTAGFATVDIGALNDPTLLMMTGLMFVGAAPASTGGGIRVTTFALLGFVLWSVVRGDDDTPAFRRRIPHAVVRQAITVVLLAIGSIIGTTLVLLAATDFSLMQTLFEATSAFGTTGLTMGITQELPPLADALLMGLMLTGRVGPVTVMTALVLRERPRLFRFPEERPIVG